ncbi:MAG: nucleoside triphosphate pyrophosphohydrolase [Pseudomonadaceae bacterium]|nr:nucleoside triphosphate pyrophosphohydrolase [Pseudomonadaceae bacterium]
MTQQLVRDKRVEMLEADGCTVQQRRLSPAELVHQLRGKLMEEATEAALADDKDELAKELADVLEVVEALALAGEIGMDKVQEVKQARFDKLGGYGLGVFSETVTVKAGSESEAYHRQFPDKYKEVEE